MNYAIIGFGTAGYHALKKIREYDPDGEIDVYSDTGKAPYNPMLTTYYVYGKLDHDGMYPYGDVQGLIEEFGFNLYDEKVQHVYASDKTVETASGRRAYDRILISTGASAQVLPVAGLDDKDRYVMRTVEDAERLKQRISLNKPRTAIVIGASMVGIKVVELLNAAGVRTWLLGRSPNIFPRVAYPQTAEAIEARVKAQGVHLHFGATIDHMENESGEQIAVLTDSSKLQADIVVLCAGTTANISPVKDEVQTGKGILVDSRMQTSADGIYAAGDCCESLNIQSGANQIIGLWANANRQGDVAGANMTGNSCEFTGNILHNITHFMNMDFIGFGETKTQGEVLEYGDRNSGLYVRMVISGGKIAGANILDSCRISGIVKNYMLRLFSGEKALLPDYQKGMLIKAGLSRQFINTLEEKLNG